MNLLNKYIADQSHSNERYYLLRILTGAIICIWITFTIDVDFYSSLPESMYKPNFILFFIPYLNFSQLFVFKVLSILIGLLFIIGFRIKYTSKLFFLLFFFLLAYLSAFDLNIWNGNNHLLFILFLLACVSSDSKITPAINADKNVQLVLFLIQLYIGVLYFQAFLSKMIFAGMNWFIEGNTIRANIIFSGTEIGKQISIHSHLFAFFGICTMLIEFSILPLIFFRKYFLAGLLGILFHLSTWIFLDISFWFLWLLYPILFLYEIRLFRKLELSLIILFVTVFLLFI
ncbi:hypothetical protein BH11BAC2_BH11BAC2_15840 [soil metagenome]